MPAAGCDGLGASGAQSAGDGPAVEQIVRGSPEEVVRGFLDAWRAGDLRLMYSFVSPPVREQYPYEVFERRYTVARETMGYSELSYQIQQVQIQGVTAAVNYSVTLQSPFLGSVEDAHRTMRLVQVDHGWQIAWTPMDILDGLASEVSIQVLSRFPPRANIYDRRGNYVVEEGGTIVTISVIQHDMSNVDDCLDLLAEVMQESRNKLLRLFQNYNPDTFFYVGEVDAEVYAARQADLEDICGLANESAGFVKVTQYQARRYVGHGAAAHITGYIGRIPAEQLAEYQQRGYRAGDIVGLAGIERWYQDELAGKPERYLSLVEPGGAVIRELGGTTGSATIPVQLTIDMGLQNAVSQAISDAFNYAGNNWASRAGGAAAIVMDVNTGAILALASYPTFDPSVFNPDSSYVDPGVIITDLVNDPLRPLINKAVTEQYTPGSVYKIFTTAAAAAGGIWNPSDIFNCELLWYGGERYGDALEYRQDWRVVDELPAAGEITMPWALTASCNPFFWEMGALMFRRDPNMQADYAAMFGFGSRTGVSVLGPEAAGNIARPASIAEAINNAIGQGNVQATALQMVTAVSAVANRGTLYAPYIVQQVGGFDGAPVREAAEPRVVRELDIPDEVFAIIWEGMCNVPIDKKLGTAWYAFGGSDTRLTYTSCGKTGTAQAGTIESGIPPNAWYVSFAPADKPEIATVVIVPTSREGSEVAAPITRRILDYYFDAPEAAFPGWWAGEYIPVKPPVGVSGQ